MAKETVKKVPYMSMGSDLFNLLVGGDKGVMGLPYGAILNLAGDKSSGKAQPLYSKVLTPTGWKTMEDINVGDEVVTPFRGETAHVLAVFPQGKRDTYRFHFNDGTVVDSADNHYWVMQSPNQYSSAHKSALGHGKGHFLVTTTELAELYGNGTPASADMMALPIVEPIEYSKNLPKGKVPPYLMGLFISEGGLTTSGITITNPENDVIEKARIEASKVGLELRLRESNQMLTYGVVQKDEIPGRSWLPEYIRELGLDCKSTEKHIPQAYLLASVEDRIALLHGLFDGDGWITKNGNAVYSTSSKQLAGDVADLARSLGIKVTVSLSHTPFYIKEGKRVYCTDHYRIHMGSGSVIRPFSSEKHMAKWESANAGSNYTRQRRVLQSVEYIGLEECKCIYLDHPRHLYITDNYIPTHNTFIKNEIIAANYHANGGDPDKFAWFSDDCESGDTFNTEALYGVNIRPIDGEGYLRIGSKKVQDSATVEDMDAHVSLFLEHLDKLGNDAVGIYAIDSLDGLSDAAKEAMEGARLGQLKSGNEVKDKGDYGMQIPKFLSQNFFRPKHKKLEDAHCSLIIVSQIRDKVDSMGYGQKWDVSCGKALEFYCHTRIFLQTIAKLGVDGRPITKSDDLVTGAYVKATTFKSKTPRPYRTIYYTVYFNYGIDNIGSNLDFLFDLRGKDGKFVEGSDSIKWVEGRDLNKDTLAKWLTDVGVMDEVKAANKARGGNYQIPMKFQQEWLAERFKTDPALQEKYIEYFGRQYTRDELIRMCEADPKMNAELTRRVIAKWEAREDSIPVRPSKYGGGRFTTPAPQPAEPVPLAERPVVGGEPWEAPDSTGGVMLRHATALSPDTPEGVIEGGPNAETPDSGA